MTRAGAKASLQWVFGRAPGGPSAYRWLTRVAGGTQATHVDKLARVVPGYIEVWERRCDVDWSTAKVTILEPGYTPFWALSLYLNAGRGPTLVNHEARFLDRYVGHAVDEAVRTAKDAPEERVNVVKGLRDAGVHEALSQVGAVVHEAASLTSLSIESGSQTLVHSGGILEHFRPETLSLILAECRRVLAPGGIVSHVIDHRDHLYHADKSIEPMDHLRFGSHDYEFRFGHRLGYHNRLSPTQVTKLFKASGFEPIAVRRMILPDQKYVDEDTAMSGLLGCSKLHQDFADWSEVDLRTAACHYLFRLPSRDDAAGH